MSEAKTDSGNQAPDRRRGIITSAFVMSAPAFYFVIANEFGISGAGGPLWIGLILLLVLCTATVASFVGLLELPWTTALGNSNELPNVFSESTKSVGVQIARAAVAGSVQFCYWVTPCIWLFFTSCAGAYLVVQIWPQVQTGGLWVVIPLVAALVLASIYVPSRSVGGGVAILSFIGAMQIAALLVFSILALVHRPNAPSGTKLWVLDSTGTPTQYVQDTVLDVTQSIQDPQFPNDPGKRIQKPEATTPKVDSNGNAIWVYDAVDAKGKVLVDATGHPIVVPTDAEGKMAPLPAGAASAVPEQNKILYSGDPAPSEDSVLQQHDNAMIQGVPIPLDRSYAIAWGCIALAALAVFQFVTSLGQDIGAAIPRVPKAILLLFLLQSVVFCLPPYILKIAITHFDHSPYTVGAGSSSAPIGDVMQLVGAWLFGSARAGWWFMMSNIAILLLVLIASTRMSLFTQAGKEWTWRGKSVATGRSIRQPVTNAARHAHMLLRAGVAALFCAWEMRHWANNTPWLSTGGVGAAGDQTKTRLPDILFILSASVPMMVCVLCAAICFEALSAFGMKPNRKSARRRIAPAIGLVAGTACLGLQLAGLFILDGENANVLLWALMLCVACGIGVAIYPVVCRKDARG